MVAIEKLQNLEAGIFHQKPWKNCCFSPKIIWNNLKFQVWISMVTLITQICHWNKWSKMLYRWFYVKVFSQTLKSWWMFCSFYRHCITLNERISISDFHNFQSTVSREARDGSKFTGKPCRYYRQKQTWIWWRNSKKKWYH